MTDILLSVDDPQPDPVPGDAAPLVAEPDRPQYANRVTVTVWSTLVAVDRSCATPTHSTVPLDRSTLLPWGVPVAVDRSRALPWIASLRRDRSTLLPWGTYARHDDRSTLLPWGVTERRDRSALNPWGTYARHDDRSTLTPWGVTERRDRSTLNPWGVYARHDDRSQSTPWGVTIRSDRSTLTPWGVFTARLAPGWGTPSEPGPGAPDPDGTIRVPILGVYFVLNEVYLRRVDTGLLIEADSATVSVDVDSWVARWSASVPPSALADVRPDPDPVLVELVINGTAWRLYVETLERQREYGRASLRVSGRGWAAALGSPYAGVTEHLNTSARTARQVIDDALAGTGWTLDWQLTDWLLPARALSVSGPPIAVAQRVADAAGAVLQAAEASMQLRLLPYYPTPPWDWATATPDLELPADAVLVEGVRWIERPVYNRVFVSGQAGGVLGQVTRYLSAGDKLAPMVTDSLITHSDAARQKGLRILADSGPGAMQSLRLPALLESGVLQLGWLVDFQDGADSRRGLVRAVTVTAGRPAVWQSVEIETHA